MQLFKASFEVVLH